LAKRKRTDDDDRAEPLPPSTRYDRPSDRNASPLSLGSEVVRNVDSNTLASQNRMSNVHNDGCDRHAIESAGVQGVPRPGRRKEKKTSPEYSASLTTFTADIDYRCSEALISQMSYLGVVLFDAVQTSLQWGWERGLGGLTSDCLNAIVPKNRSEDISLTLRVGHEQGLELIEKFQLRSM